MFDDVSSVLVQQYTRLLDRVKIVFNPQSRLSISYRSVILAVMSGCVGVVTIIIGILQAVSGTTAATSGPVRATSDVQHSAADFPVSLTTEKKDDQTQALVVDVAGAVLRPGVYALPPDARMADALEAAGGPSEQADAYYLSRILNQSIKLTDGQKIFVPSPTDQIVDDACRELIVTQSSDEPTGDELNGTEEQRSTGVDLLSINAATQAELESLPGIGSKRASDIINGRPYHDIDELRNNEIVTNKIYDDIKKLIKI